MHLSTRLARIKCRWQLAHCLRRTGSPPWRRSGSTPIIREASTLAPNAAFVMITGHNLSAQEDELAQLKSLRGFLAKPFGWRKLADEILRVWPPDSTAPSHRADATSL